MACPMAITSSSSHTFVPQNSIRKHVHAWQAKRKPENYNWASLHCLNADELIDGEQE
jgi:hypothetical protein